MQVITKQSNNTLVFTLSEKVTLTAPYYFLFSLKGQTEMNPKNFIVADTSIYPNRYNKFLVTETSGTENLTSGVVNLSDAGFYEYAIYEQTSSTNLDIRNTTSLLEIGMIKVNGSAVITQAYDNQTKTYITYGEG
jgi:hypothetical protein